MRNMVINYIRELDISIKKKMFLCGKKAHIQKPPSPLQVRIFMYLYNHKDLEISPTDLVKELKVSKVAISEALIKMQNNGNVLIKESLTDGRKKVLTYTEQGKKRMEEMLSSLEMLNEILTKNISDKELEVFINVIKKMKENLEEEKDV